MYYHDALSGCPASVMNITVNMVTQGVVFINLRHPGFTSTRKDASSSLTSIDICEVKVMGKPCVICYINSMISMIKEAE